MELKDRDQHSGTVLEVVVGHAGRMLWEAMWDLTMKRESELQQKRMNLTSKLYLMLWLLLESPR